MQDALPALVLNSEALVRHAMDETPTSQSNPASSSTSAGTGVSDERLMLAFSKGSSDAFTELFSRYKQPIYGFFRRRVAEPAHAEELTQETFFALLRAAARYEPRALFRTYLYAIGLKILRAHRRKAASPKLRISLSCLSTPFARVSSVPVLRSAICSSLLSSPQRKRPR